MKALEVVEMGEWEKNIGETFAPRSSQTSGH